MTRTIVRNVRVRRDEELPCHADNIINVEQSNPATLTVWYMETVNDEEVGEEEESDDEQMTDDSDCDGEKYMNEYNPPVSIEDVPIDENPWNCHRLDEDYEGDGVLIETDDAVYRMYRQLGEAKIQSENCIDASVDYWKVIVDKGEEGMGKLWWERELEIPKERFNVTMGLIDKIIESND